MILKVQSVAATTVGVESYVESLVSTNEHHFYKKRNPEEDTINFEFNIAVNGPVVTQAKMDRVTQARTRTVCKE